MLFSLNTASRWVGLGMNLEKTKVMFTRQSRTICRRCSNRRYPGVYLPRTNIAVGYTNFEGELDKCDWVGQCLESCVASLELSYHNPSRPRSSINASCQSWHMETWNLTAKLLHRLHLSQRAMKRYILGV